MPASSRKDWTFPLPADLQGTLVARPNRFLALVETEEGVVEAHVHDPGRLPQIMIPGNSVLLRRTRSKGRRTSWDLLAGRACGHWVLVHSGLHRHLTQKLLEERGRELFPGLVSFRAEPRLSQGRLDYLFQMKEGPPVYVETKGCTLAEGDKALFPDAPTLRGRKHLEALIDLKKEGYQALLWVLVFRPETRCFSPEERIDPRFAEAFSRALSTGVKIRIHQFIYDGQNIRLTKELPLCSSE